MVFTNGSRQYHSDDVCGQNSFAPRPHCQSAHREQHEQQVLRFEFGDPPSIDFEEPRGEERQDREYSHARADEDQSLDCERREDEAQRDYGSQVIHKTGCQNGLPEICDVETEFQHHCVNDGYGGRGQSNSCQPTRSGRPMQDVVSDCRAAQERADKSHQADHR